MADAHGSGPCVRKDVGVQLPPRPPSIRVAGGSGGRVCGGPVSGTFELPADSEGVLPNQYLQAAVDAGVIEAGNFRIPSENIQPASLDLRLSETAYRIRGSFLPGNDTVGRRGEGIILEPNP